MCRARKENKDKAAAHVKAGNKQAAYECYQRAVDISPATANDFAKVCKQDKLELHIMRISSWISITDLVLVQTGPTANMSFPYAHPMATMQYNSNAFAIVVMSLLLAAQRLTLTYAVGIEGCRRGVHCCPI